MKELVISLLKVNEEIKNLDNQVLEMMESGSVESIDEIISNLDQKMLEKKEIEKELI